MFFEPGPFPGLPGLALGPKGPKIGHKPGAEFIMLSSLRSAPLTAGVFGRLPSPVGGPPPPQAPAKCGRVLCADLREDKMINPASDFGPIFGPSGPTAGPGSLGNGPGLKNSAGCTKNQPRRPIISPICGHFVFLGTDRKHIKR